MLKERLVSIQNALCSALVLGAATLATPVLAAPPLTVAPDGVFEGKFDTTVR